MRRREHAIDGSTITSGLRGLFADDFTSATDFARNWAVDPASTLTASPNDANSRVDLTIPATSGALWRIYGTQPFSLPARALFTYFLDQKLANVDVAWGFVAVKEDGTPDWSEAIELSLDITVAASSTLASVCSRTNRNVNQITAAATVGTVFHATNPQLVELIADPEGFTGGRRTANTATGRGAGHMLDDHIPDPYRRYVPYVCVMTTGTKVAPGAAPIAGTNPTGTSAFQLRAVRVMDCTEVYAEITGGRGSTVDSVNAMPVNVVTAANQIVVGTAAHDAAVSGAPVLNGFDARTSTPSAVSTTGDVVRGIADMVGRQVIKVGGVPGAQDMNCVTLSGTSETTLIAAVASVKHEIQTLVFANESAANVVTVLLRDTTGGTVRMRVQVPIGSTVVVPVPSGMTQVAANTNWTVQASGTSPNVSISAVSYRAA